MVTEPYAQIAATLDIPVDSVIGCLRQMLSAGVIRRIGAVPNHYRLGLRGNGMTVWDVPDEAVAELGERIGAMDFVSHCYERPRHPGVWPYNLFAMVHGHDRGEVHAKAGRLRRLLGDSVRAHDVLFSTAVLKKTGLRLAA
jgi:DNA-binding Lrp family transcriptional regulator